MQDNYQLFDALEKIVIHVGDALLLPFRRKLHAIQQIERENLFADIAPFPMQQPSFQKQRLRTLQTSFMKNNPTMTSDVVTAVDLDAEQFIASSLRKLNELAVIVGEESGKNLVTQGYLGAFVFDPLDGTAIFSYKMKEILSAVDERRHIDHDYRSLCRVRVRESDFSKYCVHITQLSHELPVVDVVYAPERQELFGAIAGKGAFLYKHNASVPLAATFKQLYENCYATCNQKLVISDSYLPSMLQQEYRTRYVQLLRALQQLQLPYRRFGYTSAVYECLATVLPVAHPDKTDLYVNPHLFVWDVPVLAVREAGGEVIVAREHEGAFAFSLFDYRDFELHSRVSIKYNKPFFVFVGEKKLVQDVVGFVADRIT